MEFLGKNFTDKSDSLVGIFGRGGLARTDSPYGFVGDDDFIEIFRLKAFETFDNLLFKYFFGKSAYSFGLGFAY